MPMVGCCRINRIDFLVCKHLTEVFFRLRLIHLPGACNTLHGLGNSPFIDITYTGYLGVVLTGEGTAHAGTPAVHTDSGNAYSLIGADDIAVTFGRKAHSGIISQDRVA